MFEVFINWMKTGEKPTDAALIYLVVLVSLSFFSLKAAIEISRNICFHPFSTVCLWNGSAKSLYCDWQAACWADEDQDLKFVYCVWSSKVFFSRPGATSFSVHLFPTVVVSAVFGQSVVSLRCWQSQPSSTFCCHPGGLKSTLLVFGPLKMVCRYN